MSQTIPVSVDYNTALRALLIDLHLGEQVSSTQHQYPRY